MKALVAGFPSKRQSAMGVASGVQAKPGREEKALSMKFEVAPESMRAGMGLSRLGSYLELRGMSKPRNLPHRQ
jgi:hypothetical protein